jgi:nitrate reductase gamma subunit
MDDKPLVSGASRFADAVSGASAAVGRGPLEAMYSFVMVPMVYLSVIVLLVGVVVRVAVILRSPANPYQLTIYPKTRSPWAAALRDAFLMPQVRAARPAFWAALVAFHVAFILLILGHLDLLPRVSVVPEDSPHMLGRGLVGVVVTGALVVLLLRRFRSPQREISTPGDYLLLLLLLFLSLLGDAISWSNSWTARGFVITKAHVANYVDGLARFTFENPRTLLPGSHYHFVVLHVLLANLLFMTLPFTKIMHSFLALPINVLRRR